MIRYSDATLTMLYYSLILRSKTSLDTTVCVRKLWVLSDKDTLMFYGNDSIPTGRIFAQSYGRLHPPSAPHPVNNSRTNKRHANHGHLTG